MDLEFHQLELTYKALRCPDEKRRALLVASLCEHGQQSPVLVIERLGQPGRYVLIDGYQRVAALERLGHDTVCALVLALDEVSALCLMHRMEGAQRRSALEQGWLLAELVERHGVSQAKLALLLSHSTSWVSRRLALIRELPELAQELVRKGRLCPHGAMRHLVPLARAKRKDCERLLEQISANATYWSARQLGRLAMAWRSADATERGRIVEQPLLYLRAEAATAGPVTELPSPERQLRNDLEALGAIARRCCRRLHDEARWSGGLPLVLKHVWQQTQLAWSELQQTMEGGLNAGLGCTTGGLRAQEQGPRHQDDRTSAADL